MFTERERPGVGLSSSSFSVPCWSLPGVCSASQTSLDTFDPFGLFTYISRWPSYTAPDCDPWFWSERPSPFKFTGSSHSSTHCSLCPLARLALPMKKSSQRGFVCQARTQDVASPIFRSSLQRTWPVNCQSGNPPTRSLPIYAAPPPPATLVTDGVPCFPLHLRGDEACSAACGCPLS